jgi:transposase
MYRIAGIDVHKKVLAVVVTDIHTSEQFEFQRRQVLYAPEPLRELAEWLVEQEVEEVVMESTAQYWQPVWSMLEQHWQPQRKARSEAGPKAGELHLAQAQTNRAPRGRKNDFADAERLVRRLVSQELILSFVPTPEQRLWRTLTRRRTQLMQARSSLQSQMESLLEEAHLKLAPLASDLFGVSMIRILRALAQGESDPAVLAALADRHLRATKAQLMDALSPCRDWSPHYRTLIRQMLSQLALIETQIEELEQGAAQLMSPYEEAILRLAEIPGMGAVSALHVIAEIGPQAQAFPSPGDLCSWVGVIPGENITAGHNYSTHSPKGNRHMRRLLNQVAHAAVKTKGSIFQLKLRKFCTRMKYPAACWAVAHFLCELIWIVLHRGVRYQERGPGLDARNRHKRIARMIRELKAIGFTVLPGNAPTSSVA